MNLLKRKILILIIIFLLIDISFYSVSSTYITSNNYSNGFLKINQNSDFDDNITSIMKELGIPSISAAIIKNNSIVWYKGYGFYEKLFRKKPTANTCYLAGSVSKAITATALLQLYEKGFFNLDDDVSEYLSFCFRNPNYPDEPMFSNAIKDF